MSWQCSGADDRRDCGTDADMELTGPLIQWYSESSARAAAAAKALTDDRVDVANEAVAADFSRGGEASIDAPVVDGEAMIFPQATAEMLIARLAGSG